MSARLVRWTTGLALFAGLGAEFRATAQVNPDPASGLRLEFRTAYNFVVDSNVKTPATYAPTSAYIGARICNDGTEPLTDVVVTIGNHAANTPGVYPTVTHAGDRPYAGTFALRHLGGRLGTADAVRAIGTLAPGECRSEFWLVTYPRMDSETIDDPDWNDGEIGVPVWGEARLPEDDLTLRYDLWASGRKAGVPVSAWDSRTATLRSELSAMANKIWPNTSSKVPPEYLDLVESPLGWGVLETGGIADLLPGQTFTLQGIWYDFGVVNQGFDNNGDLVPDYNVWMQPIGDPAFFDPGCFRLARARGLLIVKLNDGTEQLIPFEDQLYFENLPPNNRGVVGIVYYSFLALNAPCLSYLSPYQEAASGRDNEKFNADFGVLSGPAAPPAVSEPSATLTKTGAPNPVTPAGQGTPASDGLVTWTLDFANTSTVPLGNPALNAPVVIRDAIPAGTTYAAGSATASVTGGATVRYSTDGGLTFSTGEPAPASAVTHLEWWLLEPLAVGGTGSVSFQVVVPGGYVGVTVPNTASLRIGAGLPFTEATAAVLVTGTRTVGDRVWDDNGSGAGGVTADGLQNGTEPGLAGVLVKLYWDVNHDGVLDAGDILVDSQLTGANGAYTFTALPAARFLVSVDPATFPEGYGPTTLTELPADLTAENLTTIDFGLVPALSLDKRVLGSTSLLEGQEVHFQMDLVNRLRPTTGSALTSAPVCEYTAYPTVVYDTAKFFNNRANAAGAPDGNFASGNFNNYKTLEVGEFSFGGPLPTHESILLVEALVTWRRVGTLTDDSLQASLSDGGVIRFARNIAPAQFNALPESPAAFATAAWDVTGAAAWQWAKFASPTGYRLAFNAGKSKAADGELHVDAYALRVTTDCGEPPAGVYDPHATVHPITLQDTFDPAQLEFVSATIVPTSVDAVNGVVTWAGLGPINPGSYERLTVTFRLRSLPNNQPATVLNTASVTQATFADGRAANEPADAASVNVGPAGSISGFVWSDTNSNGWQPAASPYGPGYQSGEPFLGGVTVQLLQCTEADNPAGTCTEWVVIGSTVTAASGFYEFTGLTPGGRYATEVVTTGYVVPLTATGDPDDDPNPARGSTGNGSTCGGGGGNVPCNQRWDDGLNLFIGTSTHGTYSPYTASAYDYTHINFGYAITQPALYGYLWRDVDGDGVFDPSEAPLPNVGVFLDANNNGVWDTGETRVETDPNGRYQFTGLTAGQSHRVAVDLTDPDLPAGSYQTGDPDETGPCTTCDHRTVSATLVAGQVAGPYNFGYFTAGTSTIGDTVYRDANGNGSQDSGETGLAGVRLWLLADFNGNQTYDPGVDILLAEQTTDAQGAYLFSGLAAGTYFVVLDDTTLPAGYGQTDDPDEPDVCVACNDRSNAVTVNGSTSNLNIDFGYQPPAATGVIGDTLWRDLNGDGVQSGATETGIADVTVWLCLGEVPVCNAGIAAFTTVTDSQGQYRFADLPDGTYTVAADTGDPQLPQDLFGNPYQPTTVTRFVVSLASGNSYLAADVGFGALAALGDFIFYDANRNGQQDFNEAGIGGVTVYLYRESVPGSGVYDELVATTITADGTGGTLAGSYRFEALPAVPYQVRVETTAGPLAGLFLSADPDADGIPCEALSPTTEPPDSVCDGRFTYTRLGYGAFFSGADFGFVPGGVLGDFVWLDLDQDGIQGTFEQGLANVRVFVDTNNNGLLDWTDANADGLWDTGEGERWVYTDLDGQYLFYNLPDGSHRVVVDPSSLPPALAPSYDPAGGILSPTGATPVTLAGGVVTSLGGDACSGCDLDVDFGYKYNAALSLAGTVCLDDDPANDGVCTGAAGEAGLSGYLVYLYTSGRLLGAVETQADGTYLFAGLPPATYQVVFGTTSAPLDEARLTTELGDTPATTIQDYGTSVAQTVVLAASVGGVDFAFQLEVDFDFGDLPDTYGTTYTRGGARHRFPDGGVTLHLGNIPPDAESNGQPSAPADGDDAEATADEDGVQVVDARSWLNGPNGGQLDITVTGAGWLVGWIDFDQNGSFLGTGEMIVNQAVTAGTARYAFPVPVGTFTRAAPAPELYARFRLFAASPVIPAVASVGQALDGEVEDYRFAVGRANRLTGTVYADTDGDADFSGYPDDTPLAGVEVRLYLDLDGDGTADPDEWMATTTTDLAGDYAFDPLPNGRYLVLTFPPDGADALTDADGLVNGATLIEVTVLNADVETRDFLLNDGAPLAAIRGAVFADTDTNGGFSAGDTPLEGITVSLYRDLDGDGVPDPEEFLGSTLTDAGGAYAFTGLPEGDYLVVETDPAGYVSVTDVDGPTNGTNVIAVTLAGSDQTGNNFLDEPAPPTAAQLARFEAERLGAGTVILSWDTLVEIETLGFYVDRSTTGHAWERVGTELVPATGQDRLPQSYRYADTAAPSHSELRYRLVEVEWDGRQRVLAETMAAVRLTPAIVYTPAGWRLAVSGVPTATVRVETAMAVTGPWVPIQTLTLDARGRGTVNLGPPGFEAARFFRLGLD